ncbi:hypothetical protein DICVIV_12907 [Dictyocaulus viviparus]|uniref:C2H2-type domain-containing protein n=1 Tax=Dictyocaulus viviparus TaxID=29172 RepID=A0A0D8X976_DICVI|nr:hypothetical protein DICVIV_12907 [Dictyocaulus viviparus]
MAVRNSSCFLIDSILGKNKATDEKCPSFVLQRRDSHALPTSSTESFIISRSNDNELGSSRLTCLISNMIESAHEEGMEVCSPSPSHHFLHPKSLLTSPENFSGLHVMHQTLQYGTLSSLHHPSTIMPIADRDFFSYRSIANHRSIKSDGIERGKHKKYRCDVCEKMFSRSNTLITHK